ncbi:MAG: hypothetical protein KDB69_09290, partial [Acidimicrobiia bacterium]|nr:hypothetical protein [Acidimicrobiia bacterium]
MRRNAGLTGQLHALDWYSSVELFIVVGPSQPRYRDGPSDQEPGKVYYRNGLTSGSVSSYPYPTEEDDRIFRGNHSGPADGVGIYDEEAAYTYSYNNSVVFSKNGVNSLDETNIDLLVGVSHDNPGFVVATNHDGSGSDTLATFAKGMWRILNSWTGTAGDVFWFGAVGDIPLMGDWNCDGDETVGVFRPSTGQWFL